MIKYFRSVSKSISYEPRYNTTNFSAFTSVDNAWGVYKQSGELGIQTTNAKNTGILGSGTCSLACVYGTMEFASVAVSTTATVCTATIDGTAIDVATFAGGKATFTEAVKIGVGSVLSLSFTGGMLKKHHKLVVGKPVIVVVEKQQPPQQFSRRITVDDIESSQVCEEEMMGNADRPNVRRKEMAGAIFIFLFGIFLGKFFR